MSKHRNYNNYSKPTVPEVVKEAEDIELDAAPIEDVVPEVDPEPEVEPAPPAEPKTGIVTANKLNIRKLPSPTAEVAVIVDKGAKLMIDPEYETVEWVKVYTASGIEGYCMKKFVTVK